MTLQEIAERLRALGNPTRLAVYRMLVRAGECGIAVGKVQEGVGIPGSTLTHHMQKLMAAGLARQDRQGTSLICHANYDIMTATFEFFANECCADDPRRCVPGITNKKQKEQTT